MYKLYNSDRPSYNAICRDKAQDHPMVDDFDEIDIYGYGGDVGGGGINFSSPDNKQKVAEESSDGG